MCRTELGVGEDEFWTLTLREYAALLEQAREREHRADARIARVMALQATLLAPRKDGKAYDPKDFMPTLTATEKPKRPAAMDWRELKSMAQLANASAGGKTVTREADDGR